MKEHILSPTFDDLNELISLYQSVGSDLRRLVPCSQNSYASLGDTEVRKRWDELKVDSAVRIQAQGLLNYQSIPPAGTVIDDPFNMSPVENSTDFETLKAEQLENILVIKKAGEIISTARLLFVEGDWEIVSVVTKEEYRRQGLAATLINEILHRHSHRPLYSFQRPHLIEYYLRIYGPKAVVCPFEELTKALQRDLFRMNIFWGPYAIIRVG